MRKSILVSGLAAGAVALSVTTAEAASTTTLTAAPTSSVAGQAVTFTASIASACSGAINSHYFVIDGTTYHGTFKQTGRTATETLTIATLSAALHGINYVWRISGTGCSGGTSLRYTVAAPPSPTPSPSPSPSPPPSPISPPTPVAQVTSTSPDSPLGAYLAVALIVVAVGSGVGLAVSSRRS